LARDWFTPACNHQYESAAMVKDRESLSRLLFAAMMAAIE
jgi:hypothetical protein